MRLIDADNLKKSVMDCDLWYEMLTCGLLLI